jgi:hypothetical protein
MLQKKSLRSFFFENSLHNILFYNPFFYLISIVFKTFVLMKMKLNSTLHLHIILIKSIFLILILPATNFAQENTYTFEIQWENSQKTSFEGKELWVPSIAKQDFDGATLFYYHSILLATKGQYEISVKNLTSYSSKPEDLTYLQATHQKAPSFADVKASITQAKNQYFLSCKVFPFFEENGIIKRIKSFDIELTKKSTKQIPKKDFVASSVLGSTSSVWYKIAVSEDGIHKIDKAFLESLGINTSSLNPKHINIYGNGGGRLPEQNSTPRADDLVKNAIQVFGEADNSFDEADYILFYGYGPNKWSQNNGVYRRDMNPYSTKSYYFIRIDSEETPLRIQTEQSTTLAATHQVTTYDFHAAYEKELKNLVSGGQRFYGELFDAELVQSFPFTISNIDNSQPVEFFTSMASSSGGGSARFAVGSTILNTASFPGSANDYKRIESFYSYPNPSSNINLTITVTRPNASVLTYLDKIELNARRNLIFTGNQLGFRDFKSVGAGNVSEFTVSNFPASGFIWNITNPYQPTLLAGNSSGSAYSFKLSTENLLQFVASNGSNFASPQVVGRVNLQNLHALEAADFLIVTNPAFISQANRLADLHRSEGLTVHVVTTEQIFNEFSSGSPDPTAIRWFAKMFYDRAEGDEALMPKNLLLFGDGTYDPKNIVSNANYVLTYQVIHSEDHIQSLVTDDYFGMLDDSESIEANDKMDIGVGRLLISDLNTAKQQVDKIENYMKNGLSESGNLADCCGTSVSDGSFGDWRLNYVQITDDEEDGYFINQDAEPNYNYAKVNFPEFNADKLYSDAYPQISGAGGQRYPDVEEAINNRIQRGALMMNYIGHGGPAGAAEERLLSIPQIQAWNNSPRYNLFLSATCDFTKYDDPERVSAGEWMSLSTIGGAIAMMTTTRSVYFSINTNVVASLFQVVFTRDANQKPLSFGEIMRQTKNISSGNNNKRAFTLIGDPALRIAIPQHKIVIDSINGKSPNLYTDTIRALTKVKLKGHIEDRFGNVLSAYNGVLTPTIFDKPKELKTLGQDPKSPVIDFELQRNAIYKGKVSITNGAFDFEFIVPKDINYNFGFGKISTYAHNRVEDCSGEEQRVYVGGVNPNGINDNVGPEVEMFLNSEDFVNGGLTDETPTLIVKVFDESGINMVGNGIGHDITAILDGKTAEPIVLNDYYNADLDTYQSGRIEYPFTGIEPGRHTLEFKIWDVNNNSTDAKIEFIVAEKQEIALDHVLNYPNPFTTRTQFMFEHNQVCTSLDAQVQIFTISGKLVKTINTTVKTEGFRAEGIEWNGRDDFDDQLARGVYIYRLIVRNPEGEQAEKIEKLVLLK